LLLAELSRKDLKRIRCGTILALHINDRERRFFVVKKILRNMHLGGKHVLSLLVYREEDQAELELIVAEEMKMISIVNEE
jgi:hypothetical protein